MKQLTIYTHRYTQLLENYTAEAEKAGGLKIFKTRGRKGNLYLLNCLANHTEPVFIEGLIALLIDIALQENPVYQHSPKLRDMAGDLRGTLLYANLKRGLIRFLKHSRNLHLEGYVAFRMKEYREKLDMMSYSLIKKMKLIQGD